MAHQIVSDFIKYLDDSHTIDEKSREKDRVLKLLPKASDRKKVEEAYDEYLLDGRGWIDMESTMIYHDEDF